MPWRGPLDCDCMVVGFTATYEIRVHKVLEKNKMSE